MILIFRPDELKNLNTLLNTDLKYGDRLCGATLVEPLQLVVDKNRGKYGKNGKPRKKLHSRKK